ncbi:putative retroelement [Abeliophyllum distichum]|uniref:Retroelement n=1 Tax=Abeliophyllum distichum TaxID=126358 RepID=A0ABD1RRT6_9LAMI
MPTEWAEVFLQRFKTARSKCFVPLPEKEFVKIAQSCLSFDLKKKFQDREFPDLFQLTANVIRYERLIREEEQMKNSSKGTYYRDPNFDVHVVDEYYDQTEICLAELVKGDSYACPLASNSGSMVKNEPMRDTSKKTRVFSFDITKVDTIFDRLYKDKQIKLSNKHKLPNPEQIKDKKYCKWHNAWSHTTNNCLVFRHVLQDAIELGRITFEAKKKMAMDENPFPRPIGVNMITGFKSGLPKFKLVVDNGDEDPEQQPSVFQRLKGKEAKRDERIMCARCSREVNENVEKIEVWRRHHRLNMVPDFQPIQRRNIPFGGRPPFERQFRPMYNIRPMHNGRTFRPHPNQSNVWHSFQYSAGKVMPFDEMTRTQQRRHQRNYGRMMRQQQEILCPKMSDSPKETNTEGLEDEKEDNVGDSMEELPENSSGRSKFERRKKDENEDDPGQSITIQFGTLPPILANNYLPANEFKSKEDEEIEDEEIKENDEEEACVREVDLLGEPSGRSFDYYVLYGTPKRKVRVLRFEKYGSPPIILSPPTGWVIGEERQEESDIEVQEIEPKEQCEILHVNLVQEVDSSRDKQEVEIEAAERVVFRKPTISLTKHLRPLYVKALVNGIPVAKVLIDNGAVINTIPYMMIKKFAKTESDLIPTEVILTSFNGGATSAKGVIPLDITMGTITKTTVFFIIDGPTSYNVLLGRDWIHGNRCIPSSLHQCLVFWNDKGEAEVVQADHRPFVAEANSVERFMYEGNYGPVRVVQEGEKTRIVTQSDESFSADTFIEMFDQMRPNIVALEEPVIGKKKIDKF